MACLISRPIRHEREIRAPIVYRRGPIDDRLWSSTLATNVAQILRQPALASRGRVAAVVLGADGGARREVSYGALDLAARRIAAQLPRGGRVALVANNGEGFVTAWFGAVYAGATVVPIPAGAAVAEIVARLEHAGCSSLLADSSHLELATRAAAAAIPRVAVHDIADLVARGRAVSAPATTGADDAAMILYTSGTTGRAKGAVISHASLLLHTAFLAHHTLRLGPADVILGALPLSHSYGCRMVMLASFFAGARCVLLPRFSARGSLAAAAAEGASWIPAVPTIFAAWAALADEDAPELPRLRWSLSAGAPLPDGVRRRAEARLGAEVREGYGMTEATFSTMNAPPDARIPGSVGRPVYGVEVRVVDTHGIDARPGTAGELLVRGHNQMLGYLDDPRETAAAHRDGWVRSGDVGRVDPEGRVWVVDRIKDIILRGGHTIYPAEVEDALATHPDVVAVAVVGVPDEFYGEEVVAVVVPAAGARPSLTSLRAWSAERLAAHKHPRGLALVDSLPLGPSRKVLKRTLRAWLVDGSVSRVDG